MEEDIMCEKYNIDKNMPAIHSVLKIINKREDFVQPGDKHPRQTVPALTLQRKKILCLPMIWGLKSDRQVEYDKLIYNVCQEHVLYERFYRRELLEHPVVLPASSFYESKVVKKDVVNQYKCYKSKKAPIYLAGFYKEYREKDGSVVKRAAVLTTLANKYMLPYQCRMPILLNQHEILAWLNGSCLEYFLHRVPYHVKIEQVSCRAGES